MQRDYKAFIKDILEAIHRIESYTKNLKIDDFSKNQLYQDAVVRNLEIAEVIPILISNIRAKTTGSVSGFLNNLRNSLLLNHLFLNLN